MIQAHLPVRVYWNYKHRCYSVFQGGAVRASAREVQLSQVEFRVREGGRQRMLREGRRVIHAYAIGYLEDAVHPDDPRRLSPFAGEPVRYDPALGASFFYPDTGEVLTHASLARFDEQGMRVAAGQRAAA